MATYFSDAMAQPAGFSSRWGPSTAPSSYNPSYKRPGYATHARVRKKKMSFPPTQTYGIGDQIVLGTFKSSDRLWNLWYIQNGTLATGAADVGLYRAQLDHVPVATSDSMASIFTGALSFAAAASRTDFMTGAALGTQGGARGLAIWQILDLSTPTITADPMREYDLVLTVTTAFTAGTATIAFFEADYVSFG